MRKIVHISDIHFGRTDPLVVTKLTEQIVELGPDLLILSGDITQRARRREFAQARTFLDAFTFPKIVVPGNHDVPLYNVYARFFGPLKKYSEVFGPDHNPSFVDGEMAVAGINTARSFVIKGGRINDQQVAEVCNLMGPLDERMLKIVVTHHPFDLPDGSDEDDIVERAKMVMPRIAESGADVFLAGHLHISSITDSAHRYKMENGYSALIIQAGTAASTRGRGEPNSFNLLEFDHPVLAVKRFECDLPAAGFALAKTEHFSRAGAGWTRM